MSEAEGDWEGTEHDGTEFTEKRFKPHGGME
jgi:hypothetical protein